jgi:hypothetical protein
MRILESGEHWIGQSNALATQSHQSSISGRMCWNRDAPEPPSFAGMANDAKEITGSPYL